MAILKAWQASRRGHAGPQTISTSTMPRIIGTAVRDKRLFNGER
jgi:hypothetical protein